jgi:hypothetical protein
MVGVTSHTIDKWKRKFRKECKKTLKAGTNERNMGSSLLSLQAVQMEKVIIDHNPDHM